MSKSSPRLSRSFLVTQQISTLLAELQVGERLPSETVLSQELGVSRNTIRDALAALQHEGMVVREHGLGTFKAQPKQHLQASLNHMLPIPELIRQAGYTARVTDLQQSTEPVVGDIAQALQIAPSTLARVIEMLYLADDLPAVTVRYVFSPTLLRMIPNWETFTAEEGVLYYIDRHCSGALSHSSTHITAVLATSSLAERLGLSVGAPLLRFTTLGISTTGKTLYHSTSFQSGELLDVHIIRPK